MTGAQHPFAPVYDQNSRVLILGSWPSPKSREQGFFYGHPQNRFWRVLAALFSERTPESIGEKREFLLSHKIAVWDIIASCDIEGSSDSSIKSVIANDITPILKSANIEAIFVNGRTAEKYYNKYTKDVVCREAICLPSTSPANAAYSLEKLTREWGAILNYR